MQLSPFGRLVRQIRMRSDLSLKQMADAMGLGSAQLSSIEFGTVPLDAALRGRAVDFLARHATAEELQMLRSAELGARPSAQACGGPQALVQAFAARLKEGE